MLINKNMPYPFTPKSNKSLAVGDYWIITLDNHKFAIGIVVDIPSPELKLTTQFIAGLLDWSSNKAPLINDFKNRKILAQGKVHIKSIIYTGGQIVGNINLNEFQIEPLIQRSQIGYQPSALILKGYKKIRNMEWSDLEKYPVLAGWGIDIIKIEAEKLFGKD